MKHTALVVLLAGILGASTMTAQFAAAFTQDNQEKLFYVTGYVKRPGSYRFVGDTMTVGEAIEVAGGVTERGATDRYRLMRKQDGKRVDLVVNADDSIEPNDTISVFRKAP